MSQRNKINGNQTTIYLDLRLSLNEARREIKNNKCLHYKNYKCKSHYKVNNLDLT